MSGSVPFARFVAVGVLLLAVLFGWTIPGCRFLNARRTTYSSFEAEQLSRENAQNPLQVRGDLDPYQVWETTVDVVRLYFDRIIDEYPCQRSGETITEGLLRTKPQTGSTCFEPWRRDSVNASERHYATVQSIRRTAKIRVRHANGHYIIHVRVDKELEDLAQPSYAQLPSATFRLDTQIPETTDPIAVQDYNEGWLPQGRDYALEQSILNQLQVRLDALSHAQL
ncbi:MAG: hypothetical protein IJK97_07115 [Thermoguttaceae bacterium]|nr:hypothetical protein [Thermoguttaceae bacterium]MBR0191898.1 hypothetical protein [Thermoguttaceae bacterium]